MKFDVTPINRLGWGPDNCKSRFMTVTRPEKKTKDGQVKKDGGPHRNLMSLASKKGTIIFSFKQISECFPVLEDVFLPFSKIIGIF